MTTFPTTGQKPWGTVLKTYVDNLPVDQLGATSVKHPTYGATGGGVADDTAAFTAAIASGAKQIVVPPGTYVVNGLTMNQANQTLILAAGATLKAKTGGTQTMITVTANGVQIVGDGTSTFDGNSVGTTAGSTIFVNAATDVQIDGCTFINCAGLVINAQGDRVTINNNTITNPGSTAIFLANISTSVDLIAPTVTGNRISVASGGSYGIQSHVNGARIIQRPRFAYNDIKLPALATSGIGIELFGGNSFGAVVGNTIEGSSIGISVDLGPSIAVTGNSVHGPNLIGIEFASSTRSTCSGNTIDGNGVTDTGISISNTAGGWNTVSGNAISNLLITGTAGVHVQQTAGNATTISGNSITARKPIAIGGQSGHTIVGNTLVAAGSTVAAIDLDTVTNSLVANNTCINFGSACVNVFTGTMNGLIIGPNVLGGTTPADMLNGWTPGTNGVNSRLIRANSAVGGLVGPTVGASPWTFTNVHTYGKHVYVKGGTVSSIVKGGFTLATASPAMVWLASGESVVITYTVAPTVVTDGL